MEFGRSFLYILFFFPLLILFLSAYQISKKKKILFSLFNNKSKIERYKKRIRKEFFINLIFVLSISFFVLSLMLPKWGVKSINKGKKKSNIVFVLDNSYSMLAEDIYPNRLEKAKEIILSIANKYKGKDFLSLIIFAGDLEVLVPPTSDSQNFSTYLMTINPKINSLQGSYIGKALESLSPVACNSLKNSIYIILSDGESFDNSLEGKAQKIKECGNELFFIGIGSDEGAPIPIRNEQFKIIGWKKDLDGKTVITKLNSVTIIKMIKNSDNYAIINSPLVKNIDIINKVTNMIKKYEKHRIFIKKSDKSAYPLFIGFFLLLFYGVYRYGRED